MIDKMAYREGKIAFKEGNIHNPYNKSGTDKQWGSWNRGYNDARKASAKEEAAP